jgi:hypothetical protein
MVIRASYVTRYLLIHCYSPFLPHPTPPLTVSVRKSYLSTMKKTSCVCDVSATTNQEMPPSSL